MLGMQPEFLYPRRSRFAPNDLKEPFNHMVIESYAADAAFKPYIKVAPNLIRIAVIVKQQ